MLWGRVVFGFRLSTPVVFSVLLLGCASGARIADLERQIYMETAQTISDETVYLDTVTGNSTYALNLAQQYIVLANEASTGQDVFALGLISAATVGAGAVVFNGHLDILRGVGLAAGTATATSDYLRPAETSAALLVAAERLICIAEVARAATIRYQQDNPNSDIDIVEIVQSGIRTVRINLRQSLTRSVPTYSTLFNQVTSSARIVAQSGGDEEIVAKLNQINQKIIECATLTI